ncbi:MAG: hypothetical protein WBX49_09095 [Candidatus Deferrimicrobiaceae bacterium]
MRPEAGQHRKRLGVILIALGCGLLAASAFGLWTHMGNYRNYPPRPWERFDPSLVKTTRDLDALYRAAEARAERPFVELPPSEKMQILYETVSDRFTHGDRAVYSPFSNWVMWTLGHVNRRYLDIQDPDVLLRNGHSALCGDVSYVLIRLASKAGIPARHVLLNGHIVMEAWYTGGWHAYDPDLEVAVKDPGGIVLGAEALFGNPDLLRQAYAGRGSPAFLDNLVSIYITREDNLMKTYPAESGIAVKGQRPGRVEQAARHGRTLLPTAMVLIGAYLAGVPRRKER